MTRTYEFHPVARPLVAALVLVACEAPLDGAGAPFASDDEALPLAGQRDPSLAPSVNVMDYGAKADGITDDAEAFQNALNDVAAEGGGEVFVPSGTYFINETLRLADNVVIRGEDRDTTTLTRGNAASDLGDTYKWIGGQCVLESTAPLWVRTVFANENYNCGNENVEIRELGIDGSLVTTVPLAVGIAFSGVKNGVIDRVRMHDMPQDAIFLKNGGEGSRVTNTLIDGFNMRWGNGGGINVEMWGDVRYPGGPLLENNTIWARGPAFCEDLITPCETDADCAVGVCPATTNVVAITASTQSGAYVAHPDILDNHLAVSEGHLGVRCFACDGSEVAGNVIKAQLSPGSPRSGRMWGMLLGGDDLDVHDNRIHGTGVPWDTRAVLVEGGAGLRFADNLITDKDVVAGSGVVTIRDQVDYVVERNEILRVNGKPSLELGPPGCGVFSPQGGRVEDNVIEASAGQIAVDVRAQSELWMVDNTLGGPIRRPCGYPGRMVFADQIAQGWDNAALSFNIDKHQVQASEPLIPADDPFTIVARVRPAVVGNAGYFLAQYFDVYSERFAVYVPGSSLGVSVGSQVLSVPATLDDGDWHSIAVMRDAGKDVTLVVDGTVVGSTTMLGSIDQQRTSIAHLDQNGTTGQYSGDIDELWVFDDALSLPDIQLLHDGIAGPEDIGPSYWDLEDYAATF